MAIKAPPYNLSLALLSVLFISLAQLAMKWGMSQLNLHFSSLSELWLQQQWGLLFSASYHYLLAVIFGLGCYGLSMCCWVMALRHLPLSLAYPLLSLSYVLVYIAAVSLPWIDETFSGLKALGIVFILCGIALVVPSSKRKDKGD
ncbi:MULTISPECIES: 4-amino-4-deoxy-L-arabinose-phosphoundecaprenol flippase subunit ArnF [unclassified Agarivorans]|uniref:4-amino-4-deoxy-L-arabinose-phosphoundecaprenol flippase subunit ArnF n=1 Tax=unclassified Agarivorans TaxID=2636026 RepID=UPI003D7EE255